MKLHLAGKLSLALLFVTAGLFSLMPPAAHAQAQENIANIMPQDNAPIAPDADDANDPPTRVARISYLDGSVSFQPGGTGDWGAAAKNRPVTIGDKLWADKDSRAELQAGQAAIHVGSMTALSFLNLNATVIQMRLAEGHVNFRVRELRAGDNYEVDTPNAAITVREAGAFRVDVNENGDYSTVTAIRGKAEIVANGQSFQLNPGERADISGTDANVKYIPGTASDPDALDRWAQERDLKEDHSETARYVSRDTVGYSDLDDYGTWRDEPEYGHVWVPNHVDVGWAPYSDGSWNWVGPWGWTWVDYSPWGFAPYHYGRWNYFGSYWGWCPGPIYATPYYGPAFVGFLGGGFGFGVGFGWGGGYGWFPLGWGEPFHPWYHCGGAYWHNVNVYNTHINNFNSINRNGYEHYNYRYAHNPSAVTTASHNAFVNGQAVNRNATHLTAASLKNAQVTNGVKASPTRASYLGASNSHGRVATPSASVQNRSVVARSAPASSASHLPVHTINSASISPAHIGGPSSIANHSNAIGNNNRPNTNTSVGRATGNTTQNFSSARQSQLSANRPPSAYNPSAQSRQSNAPGRTWNAQGNTTDSGRAPRGFGSTNQAATPQNARLNSNNRPPWAGGNNSGSSVGGSSSPRNGAVNRPPTSYNNGNNRSNTQPSYNNNRTNYGRPPSSYSAPRNYNSSAPRSYNPPPARNYPAPRSYSSSPSYSAPRGSSAPHSYSAPHSSGGGGGSFHGGGSFGGSHGGGGGGGSHGSHH